jgi:hypothetical protein
VRGFFVPNKDFGKELAEDPEAREGLVAIAGVAVPFISQFYRESYRAALMPRAGQRQPIEVQATDEGVFIVNTDFGGHLAEWGSKNNPAKAPMRRGVRAAGFTLHEE